MFGNPGPAVRRPPGANERFGLSDPTDEVSSRAAGETGLKDPLDLCPMSLGAARAAAAVRVATGVIFIAEGYSKASGDFVRGGFGGRVRETASKAWPVWAGFLRDVVLPNAAAIGWLVAAGELAVGIGLVLGLWTRAAGAGGALLVLTFLLGQFYAPGGSWADWIIAGLVSKFALLLLVLLALVDAGKTWGMDGRVRRRRRLTT